MIPPEEWLHEAQRLPVGRSARVYHGAENRPNLVVYNNGDSWSCWCHSCHDWGRERKQHVMLQPVEEQRAKNPRPPSDMVPWEEVPTYQRMLVYRYLAKRGLDFDTMVQPLGPHYSEKYGRLLLPASAGAWVGRGVLGQKEKAITYSDKPTPLYLLHPDDVLSYGARVVVCEDYLSALKVRWAAPDWVPVSAQGTNLTASAAAAMMNASVVVLMLDGDAAGHAAAPKMAKRLEPLVGEVRIRYPPDGLDPKNLTADAIRKLLEE